MVIKFRRKGKTKGKPVRGHTTDQVRRQAKRVEKMWTRVTETQVSYDTTQ